MSASQGWGADRYRAILGHSRRKTFASRETAAVAVKERWPDAHLEGCAGYDNTWTCKGHGSTEPFFEGMVAHMAAKRQGDPDGPWWVRFHDPTSLRDGQQAGLRQ